jgi:serine/threonine protein kinase
MTELPAAFGKYTLTEHLATGGMATLLLATLRGPLGFEKQVVIKQIHPSLSGQPAFVDMFAAEARTLVALNHGNIVPIYELGMVDDTYFIAMEYVDGPTLHRLVEAMTAAGVRLPAPQAAWIAAEILAGLDHAHRRGVGIIHRDLSPRNVMLSRDGEVKLVDFGIAVALGHAGESGDRDPTGSFPYMSPEQTRGEPLTAASDLFSVGVLLWEMLTGARLFVADDAAGTLAAVQGLPVRAPSELAGPSAAPYDEIVLRALDRRVDQRWQTAAELRAALARIIYAEPAPPSARDLVPLIARHTPPHRVRARSTTEAPPRAPTEPGAPTLPDGPTTKVAPRGKHPRAKTFATNVALEQALQQPAPPTTATPEPSARPPNVNDHAPARSRRRRQLLAAVVAAGLVVGGGIWLATRDAPVRRERAVVAPTPDARALIVVDARGAAASAADATPAADAAVVMTDARRTRVDASPRTDARPAAPVVDAREAPAAAARLRVGAIPWGNVTVDGVARGRTPRDLELPAGAHTIDVEYPIGTPPQRETFKVTLQPGENRSVVADFSTAPAPPSAAP